MTISRRGRDYRGGAGRKAATGEGATALRHSCWQKRYTVMFICVCGCCHQQKKERTSLSCQASRAVREGALDTFSSFFSIHSTVKYTVRVMYESYVLDYAVRVFQHKAQSTHS